MNLDIEHSLPGDCCFEIFSGQEGGGSAQLLQVEGQVRLELEEVGSVYKVDCARRGIHPVLKFFLIALACVILLAIIFYKGKECLFRKRV